MLSLRLGRTVDELMSMPSRDFSRYMIVLSQDAPTSDADQHLASIFPTDG